MLIDIHGDPATFGNNTDLDWKDVLRERIPEALNTGNERGVDVTFRLASLTVKGHPRDVDNLCEPLFAVLVGTKKWFAGRRPNIYWWEARKVLSDLPGCTLDISPQSSPDVPQDVPLVDEVYYGQMPKSAKHCSLVEWAKVIATKSDLVTVGGAVRLFLSFGSDRSNIGNISSGVVKSFIDCMYPLYGGKFGHPDDWRIEHLTVEKGVSTVPELGVRVRMWDINGSPTPTPFDPLAQLNQEPVLTLSGQSQTGTPENPCRPGSAKHLVCEAAFAKNSAEKTKSGLEGLRPGSSRHLKQYIADLRSTNGLDIVISGGSVVYRGYLIGR